MVYVSLQGEADRYTSNLNHNYSVDVASTATAVWFSFLRSLDKVCVTKY